MLEEICSAYTLFDESPEWDESLESPEKKERRKIIGENNAESSGNVEKEIRGNIYGLTDRIESDEKGAHIKKGNKNTDLVITDINKRMDTECRAKFLCEKGPGKKKKEDSQNPDGKLLPFFSNINEC
jgi:hypothetical protein